METPITHLVHYLQENNKISLSKEDIKELVEFFLSSLSDHCFLYNKENKKVIKVTRKEIINHLL